MGRWPSATAASAERVAPSASALREEVFEEDRRRAGVEVAHPAQLGLARGMSLVVKADGEPELFGGGRETADALGLMPFFAAQGEGQPDDQCVDLLFARDALELCEILDHASPVERVEGPYETVRVIPDGEADTAIADVERKIAHAYGEIADDGRFSTSIVMRESRTGRRGHHSGHGVMLRSSKPRSFASGPTASYPRPARAAVICCVFGCGRCFPSARTRQWTPSSATRAPNTSLTEGLFSSSSMPEETSCRSRAIAAVVGSF